MKGYSEEFCLEKGSFMHTWKWRIILKKVYLGNGWWRQCLVQSPHRQLSTLSRG